MKNYVGLWMASASVFVGIVFGADFVVDLAWQDSGYSQNLRAERRDGPSFAKEPDAQGSPVHRGLVWLDEREPTGFLWIKQQERLYIDLNRDGDLTNDPDGILNRVSDRHGPEFEHTFEPLTILRHTEFGSLSYVIQPRLISYSDSYFYPYFSLRSGFRGQFDQHDRQWEFSVADMPGQSESRRFLCCLALPGQRSFFAWWNMPDKLFFGGHNYAVELRWTQSDNKPLLQAVFTETPAPMGQLEMLGSEIRRLTLKSENSIVLPDIGDGLVPVPAGSYNCLELLLNGQDEYRVVRPNNVSGLYCSIPQGGIGQFKAGAPLTHMTTVTRAGVTLRFAYRLEGIGGEEYDVRQATGYGLEIPRVNVYKGDLLLASGQFEYG